MSVEGPPKKNHVWPPGPQGKRVHAHEVLGLSEKERANIRKIKAARGKLLIEHHADKGGTHKHGLVINAAADEAIARAEGRWDEEKNKEIPKVTLESLRTDELTAQVHLKLERKRQNPDPLKIAAEEGKLRAIAAKRAELELEAARVDAAQNRVQKEREEAGEREREAAKAVEERERQERVEAARRREEEETAASEQSEASDQAPGEDVVEAEDTQPKEEEPVATGFDVVPYVERDAGVVPRGEVIDHPIEPPGTKVVTVRESSSEEAPAEEEPGRAVVVAESSLSGDIVPTSTETPEQGGAVALYEDEEEEYFPIAAAGGGGEGGGGDDEDAVQGNPEEHNPHHAHAHDAHHGGHHGHGDHGHDSHDKSHGAGHAAHGHSEEKKKGWGSTLWGFFTSFFAFLPETVKGFGTFFGKSGGGGGAESHGH